MQHREFLEQVEGLTDQKDHYWLARAKGLLQSDLYVTDIGLKYQPDDEALLTNRARLRAAIDKLDGLLRVGR